MGERQRSLPFADWLGAPGQVVREAPAKGPPGGRSDASPTRSPQAGARARLAPLTAMTALLPVGLILRVQALGPGAGAPVRSSPAVTAPGFPLEVKGKTFADQYRHGVVLSGPTFTACDFYRTV